MNIFHLNTTTIHICSCNINYTLYHRSMNLLGGTEARCSYFFFYIKFGHIIYIDLYLLRRSSVETAQYFMKRQRLKIALCWRLLYQRFRFTRDLLKCTLLLLEPICSGSIVQATSGQGSREKSPQNTCRMLIQLIIMTKII